MAKKEEEPNQVEMMIPRRECGHFATDHTTFLVPRKDAQHIMQEYCLVCILMKIIETHRIKPCGEIDLKAKKVLWRK